MTFIALNIDLVAVDHLDCDLGINEFLEVWDFFYFMMRIYNFLVLFFVVFRMKIQLVQAARMSPAVMTQVVNQNTKVQNFVLGQMLTLLN